MRTVEMETPTACCLLALLLCACGPPKVETPQGTHAVVDRYVRNSKQWASSSYQIRFNRKEGAALVFRELHSDDQTERSPGGGKSIEVHVDPAEGRVLKELAFQ